MSIERTVQWKKKMQEGLNTGDMHGMVNCPEGVKGGKKGRGRAWWPKQWRNGRELGRGTSRKKNDMTADGQNWPGVGKEYSMARDGMNAKRWQKMRVGDFILFYFFLMMKSEMKNAWPDYWQGYSVKKAGVSGLFIVNRKNKSSNWNGKGGNWKGEKKGE